MPPAPADQLITHHPERVVMQFGIGIRFGKVDRVFRAAEMVVIAAIEQFSLGMCEIEKGRLVGFNVV